MPHHVGHAVRSGDNASIPPSVGLVSCSVGRSVSQSVSQSVCLSV